MARSSSGGPNVPSHAQHEARAPPGPGLAGSHEDDPYRAAPIAMNAAHRTSRIPTSGSTNRRYWS